MPPAYRRATHAGHGDFPGFRDLNCGRTKLYGGALPARASCDNARHYRRNRMADPVPAAAPAYPRRFCWGMRLFLAFLLFEIVFRSFSVCFDCAGWGKSLDMRLAPRRLPTRAEIAELAAKASDENPHPVRDDVLFAFDSVWEFFKPWPEPAVRPKLRTWDDGGRWAVAWLASRLEFFE